MRTPIENENSKKFNNTNSKSTYINTTLDKDNINKKQILNTSDNNNTLKDNIIKINNSSNSLIYENITNITYSNFSLENHKQAEPSLKIMNSSNSNNSSETTNNNIIKVIYPLDNINATNKNIGISKFDKKQNKSNKKNIQDNNLTKQELNFNSTFENLTELEINSNSDLINNKINNEFNITYNEPNINNNSNSLPKLIDLSNLNKTEKETNFSEVNNETKKILLANDSINNNNDTTKENKLIETMDNDDIFEDRNFEVFLLNKKKQNKSNLYIPQLTKLKMNENNKNIDSIQLDDLSKKFKIYLENTKKTKNYNLTNSENIKAVNGNNRKNSNTNETLQDKLLNNNYTIKHNFALVEDKKITLIKSRNLLENIFEEENKLNKENKENVENKFNTNSDNKNNYDNFYDKNFIAYTNNKNKISNENKFLFNTPGPVKNSTEVSIKDNHGKLKNNPKDGSKKFEGQIFNILFSLILIALLLAGICGLIFLMLIKTNKK